jgi:hypothetical protein
MLDVAAKLAGLQRSLHLTPGPLDHDINTRRAAGTTAG